MSRPRSLADLPRDDDGDPIGQAADLAALLTSPERPITAARIRDWARRSRNPKDRLAGMLPGQHIPGPRTGTTWYRLRDAANVERVTNPTTIVYGDPHTDAAPEVCPQPGSAA